MGPMRRERVLQSRRPRPLGRSCGQAQKCWIWARATRCKSWTRSWQVMSDWYSGNPSMAMRMVGEATTRVYRV